MKYLLGLTALSIGVFAQNSIGSIDQSKTHVNILPVEIHDQPQAQDLVFPKDPLIEHPQISKDWAMIDDGNYDHKVQPQPHIPRDRKENPQKQHHQRQHHGKQKPDHKKMASQSWNHGPRDQFGGPVQGPQEYNEQRDFDQHESRDGPNCRIHKKFLKGKGLAHVLFFVVLAALSLFLVKKCVQKRKDRVRNRQGQIQNFNNPAMIDEQINKHYAEIQRLTEARNNLQRQVEVEPIIYHQTYPQEMEMSNASYGRMVNENSYPVNRPRNVQYQNIPVGRPVMINNPFSHPQIYRADQY